MTVPEGATPEALRLRIGDRMVPLGYVRDGSSVFLVAKSRSADWPISILRTGSARLELPEGSFEGATRLVPPGAGQDHVLALFEAKFGRSQFLRWYERPARVIEVSPNAAGPSAGPAAHYYRWLETEFDAIAKEYDHHILDNRMNRLLRDRSLARLLPTFRGAHRLLEIGCGSGLETLGLLRAGHEVTAVDISGAMLEVVREKARAEGLSERLTTVHSSAADLPGSRALAEGELFDGAYSTYGAVNCEPDLRVFRDAFGPRLRPRAPLLLGVYNRWCAFELIAYGLTGRWRRAFSRRTNPVRVGGSRFCVDVYAYSPGEVVRAFAPQFVLTGLAAVPLFLPPSDLSLYADRFARHFDRLDAWDARLGALPFFAAWGDHFLVTLRREGSPTGAG